MVSTELVLASAMRHRSVATALGAILTHELALPNPFHLEIGRFIVKFLAERDALPKAGDWQLWVDSLPDSQRLGVGSALAAINTQHPDSYTPEYLVEVAEAHFRQVATTTALSRLNSLGQKVSPDVLASVAEEVEKIRVVSFGDLASVKDVDKWLKPDFSHERTIPTGLFKLDQQLGGGWEEELVFVMADSGVGKTTLLINFAVAAASLGFNVLHISLENFLASSIRRYYRRIAQASSAEWHQDLEGVDKKLRHWVRFAKGNLHVMYTDAYSIDCEDVRVLAQRYADQMGGLDLLIVDYIDIMAPAKAVLHRSEPSQHAHASHRIRGICQLTRSAVLSATQATRDASGRPRLRLSDMGESYGKVRAAGVVLGLMQSEEEREMMQGRLSTLKLREHGGRGREFPLYMNMDRMFIADLDDPRTKRLIELSGEADAPREGAAADRSRVPLL